MKASIKKLSIPIKEFNETKYVSFDNNVKENYHLVSVDVEVKNQNSMSNNLIEYKIIERLNQKCNGKFYVTYDNKAFIWFEDLTDQTFLILAEKIII